MPMHDHDETIRMDGSIAFMSGPGGLLVTDIDNPAASIETDTPADLDEWV